LSHPFSDAAQPDRALELLVFRKEPGEDFACHFWKYSAFCLLVVCLVLKFEDAHLRSVVTPHFWNAKRGEEGEFVQRGTGDANFNDEIGRWINR
jgi:hypothetical protein